MCKIKEVFNNNQKKDVENLLITVLKTFYKKRIDY